MQLVASFIGSLLFVGCVTAPPAPPVDWQARQQQLSSFTTIAYQARTSVSSEEKTWSFSLNWEQRGDNFNGKGYSLLGTQVFEISGDKQTTHLRMGENDQKILRSREAIYRFTGLHLAPAELFSLIAALPLETSEQIWKDGTLESQTLGENTVRYLSWKAYSGINMPKRVKVFTSDNQLNLFFTDWSFISHSAP